MGNARRLVSSSTKTLEKHSVLKHLMLHNLLPDNDGVNADCLAIVVSGKEIEKLLAIPKVPGSGTGVLVGNKVFEILRQWDGVPEWLAGLYFDTTSSDTGV